jgi:hypothetical protein
MLGAPLVLPAENTNGQTSVPKNLTWASVSAGYKFACGVLTNGSVLCWGSNDKNQLSVPISVNFTMISAGQTHACGILASNSSLLCWGDNNQGQVRGFGGFFGFPMNRSINPPRPMTFVNLSSGFFYSCECCYLCLSYNEDCACGERTWTWRWAFCGGYGVLLCIMSCMPNIEQDCLLW